MVSLIKKMIHGIHFMSTLALLKALIALARYVITWLAEFTKKLTPYRMAQVFVRDHLKKKLAKKVNNIIY